MTIDEERPDAPSATLQQGAVSTPLRAALIVGGCLVCYAPALLQEYAFTDDWSLMADGLAGVQGPGPYIGGRPLLAVLSNLGFQAVRGSVAALAWLRLIGVGGLVTFAWVLHRHLERHGWSAYQAIAVAACCAVLPGPMLFGAWATCFPLPWALVLGGLAFVLTERAATRPSLRAQAIWLSAATTLLTAGFFIYQPAAPSFWAFFAVAFFAPAASARLALLARSAAVFGVSAGLGLAAVRIGKLLNPTFAAARTALLTDPAEKLGWFVRAPLVEAWNLVGIHGSVWLAMAVGGIAAVGVALRSRRVGIAPPIGLAVAAGLVLAAYSPNLAVAENFASFRSEASLAIMAAVLAAIGLRGCLDTSRWTERLQTPALVAAAAIFVLTASSTLQNYLVRPHAVELSWVRSALAAPATRVLVIPRPFATVAPDVIHDELGYPTVVTDWAVKAQIPLIMRERGLPPPQVVFPDGTNAAEFVVTPGTTVLDTDGLQRMRSDYRP